MQSQAMKAIFLSLCLLFTPLLQARDINLDQFANQVTESYLNGSAEKSKKSYGVAIALGLSPIPGDGLFYTKHPVQGAMSLLLGGLGIAMLVNPGSNRDCDDPGDCQALVIATGLTFYTTAYLWDAIGSVIAGRKYKKSNFTPSDPARSEKIETIDLSKDPDLE